MQRVDFWFDFISPFAYLAQQRLGELPAGTELRFRPVLFAGLLKHWDTRGPAEVAPRRRFTYRYCHWLAQQQGIAYRTPPAHPFNPLPALRASIALGDTPEVVAALYHFIWGQGRLPEGPDWQALLENLGADEALLADPAVKQALRENTDTAIETGVFGVPTFSIDNGDGEFDLFWGQDVLAMLGEYLRGPELFSGDDYPRIDALPAAVERVPTIKKNKTV